MNNLRLLTGWLCVTFLSGNGVCANCQPNLSLDDIFEIAETNSAQLRPSLTSITEAEKEVDIALAARLPDISASISVSYLGDGFTTDRTLGDYNKAPIPHFGNNVAVNISQPVYTGGAISSAIDLARLRSTAARYAADFQRDNIRFRLAGFYLDIYKYDNLRKVVENNITSATKILDEMHARYEQGTSLRNDITRYELLVSNLKLELVKINNTINILNNNLVTVAGLPDGTVILPDSGILDRSLPVKNSEWWLEEAKTNSPTLCLAQSAVDISRKNQSLVNASRLPKIGIQAGWCIDGPILVEIPPVNRNLSYWYVGVGISYDISSLYKSRRSMAKSRIATRKAIEDLDAAYDNLDLDIKSSYIRYREAYEELKTQEKSVELAERNYLTTATRYSSGMALVTDMLDAANARLEAEQRLVNARLDIIYFYYKLLFTSGKI